MDITLVFLIGLVCWVLGLSQGRHWEEWTSEE